MGAHAADTVNRTPGYKVLAPAEGASKRTPYYLKDDLVAFNARSATHALTHILGGRYGSDEYNLVIMDRGLFDALAWFELLNQNNDIATEDCSAIQEFLLVEHWHGLVDMIFLFRADPQRSLEREHENTLIQEPGRTMNESFLQQLNAACEMIKEKYAAEFSSFEVIDTSTASSTPRSTAYKVAQSIVDQLSILQVQREP